MTVREVLTYPDPRLAEESNPVENFDEDLISLIDDLKDTLKSLGGLGLAAVQIGVHKQVLIILSTADQYLALVNPRLMIEAGPEVKTREGCLSVPGVFAEVPRRQYIQVHTYTLEGEETTVAFEGRDAVVVQHEMDHLKGTVFIDKLPKVTRKRLLSRYKKVKKRTVRNMASL